MLSTDNLTSSSESPAQLSLPPELDDLVISMLFDEPETLKACALVSKEWLWTSRTYLFRDITISYSRQCERFIALATCSPVVCSWVRRLQVSAPWDLVADWVEIFLTSSLLPNFTHLETLDLADMSFDWHTVSFQMLAQLTSITRLTFLRCGFTKSELLSIVCAFPTLTDLTVVKFTDLSDRMDETGLQLIHAPSLSRLHFSGEMYYDDISGFSGIPESFVQYLWDKGHLESLRRLEVDVAEQDSDLVDKIGRLIRDVGPLLEELRMVTFHHNEMFPFLDRIDISHNTYLRKITLRWPLDPSVPVVLSRVVSPHLHTVQFDFVLDSFYELSRLIAPEVVPALEHALLATNLLGLTEVHFNITSANDLEGVGEACFAAFSELHQRRLLRVTTVLGSLTTG
ncbi:hypothetical protein EUX98_g7560 [Antrodiella citrinella]|uniref:F-box domain-containing protein n=1 Tax=Antrodiella citrinella TaxID=2447956 RepID=A0A4S4MLS0_9APHY|nr:hypothetical protein EUX98_g7560 [Antrodiella citrinella]